MKSILRGRLVPMLLIALPLLSASCSSWQRTQALSEPGAREAPYTRLRVALLGGGTLVLRDPWFAGDTLYGRSEKRLRSASTPTLGSSVGVEKGDSVAVPIERIAKVEAWRFSATRTVLLVVGIGVTVAFVAAAIALASWDGISFGDGSGSGTYSCPLIYSWDGMAWRLDSGTYAGAIMPALARTDVDNLDHAQARDGVVRLRVTGVPGETEHVDAIHLLVADLDPGCTIAPDAAGTLHALGSLREPTAARDSRRRDILRLVRANDALSWESVPTGRDTARADDIRDGIEIEFPRVKKAAEARLVVDGRYTAWADYLMSEYIELHGRETGAWYDALAADPAQARRFAAAMAREAFLEVSVWDGAGWRRQGFVPGAGPELPKRQVVPLDLSGLQGETVRVRLEAAPSLWLIDRVAIDLEPERGFVTKEIGPSEARDSRGRDVRSQLGRADEKTLVMETQDSVELRFAVDPTPPGRARAYVTAATGWYRIHTSESGEPDWTLADRLIREPRAISKLSVARLNEALRFMAAAGR